MASRLNKDDLLEREDVLVLVHKSNGRYLFLDDVPSDHGYESRVKKKSSMGQTVRTIGNPNALEVQIKLSRVLVDVVGDV